MFDEQGLSCISIKIRQNLKILFPYLKKQYKSLKIARWNNLVTVKAMAQQATPCSS